MSDFEISTTFDRPITGAWHNGPNAGWVTVILKPTMISARAYHRRQHKAKELAMACVEMMLDDCEEKLCRFPESAGSNG